MTFWECLKIWVFPIISLKFGDIHMFTRPRFPFKWHLLAFSSFLNNCIPIWYFHQLVWITELIQSKSALNSPDSKLIVSETALFSADQCWLLLFWTVLILRKSELISSEAALINSDVFHVLWISAEKRQIFETVLFGADYLWDFNPRRQVPGVALEFLICQSCPFRLGHFAA